MGRPALGRMATAERGRQQRGRDARGGEQQIHDDGKGDWARLAAVAGLPG
jgi:hypothetical protein